MIAHMVSVVFVFSFTDFLFFFNMQCLIIIYLFIYVFKKYVVRELHEVYQRMTDKRVQI